MQGLFKKNTKASLSKGKLLTCADCELFKFAKSPRMPPTGGGKKGILVCAECPGATEDKENKQLVGQSGKLLRSVLEDFDIDLDKDCIKTNTCICYSQNKTPTDTQIKCCRPNLFKTIKKFKPKKIILLGASALKSAIGEKVKIGSLEKWTGQQIPDQDIKSWLYPTYHPSFILRDSKNKALDLLFRKHLRLAIEHSIDFPDYGDERSKINVILDENKAVEYLRSILDNRYIAFDYETTGIKLNARGHKIICMSIATDKNSAAAFPMFYGEIFQDLLKKILTDFWIKKAIQNCLKGDTKILMEDGSLIPIKKIVEEKMDKKVLCYDNKGNMVARKIMYYFSNGLNKELWYQIRIKTKHNKHHYPYICCTENHKIYTNKGLVEAKDLSLEHKLLHIGGANKDLESLLIGSYLGDGGLTKIGDCFYFCFNHCVQQKGYLINLYRYIFKCGFLLSKIYRSKTKTTNYYGFRIKANSYFRELYKKLSIEYCIDKLNFKSLCKWYLDDGSVYVHKSKKGLSDTYRVSISCKRFTKEQVILARNKINSLLNGNFCKIIYCKGKIDDLGFNTKESIVFLKSILPYCSIGGSCMRYKNPLYINEPINYNWNINKTFFEVPIHAIEKKVISSHSFMDKKYDIEVEEFHNYIANGVKVSNCKYEWLATKTIFGYEVQGIYRDTMLNAHVLDNREEVTGLKFQTYIKYGTSGYNSIVEPYMESDEDFGNNSFNKLDILFKRDPISVLTYCGMDSMFTFRLGESQANELLKNNLYNASNLLLDGTLALADVENNGIRVDTNYYRNQDLIQDRKIRRISKKIQDSSEVKEWNKIKRTEFNPDSPTQLNNLFYGILKYEPTKLTNKGAPSVDKEVLFDLNTEFANLILAYRKESGLKEKINGILIETVDDVLRCHFNLNLVRSYRSSSSNVNWQNFPKRDKESFKIARSGIIPRKGHCIGEVDYGQIEVRIGSCYHHDPVMIKYITDPTTDMHRDSASEIFLLEQDQVTKKIRYHAKNKFVFPAFYGSFYAQMSPDLYKCVLVENLDDGTPLIKHLKKHGINNYEKFELHLKGVENIFWKKRFKVYDEWKTKTWEEYQRKGYIDSLTGFRYSGLMKKNDTLNLGIQGSAFHCLLQSLITLNNISKKEKWDSRIVGQIHDSMVWDFNPDELNYIIPIIKRVMCEDIKKKWEWITIPLVVDIEVAEVDSSWHDMKEYSEDEDD
jgi:uracil-DNA glycosylase family 4